MDWLIDINMMVFQRVLNLILSPTSRIYLPFLLAAFLLANYVAWTEKNHILRSDQRLFSKVTWTSGSALNDYILIITNFLFILAVQPILYPDVVAIFNAAQIYFAGFAPDANGGTIWLSILLAFSLFMIDDFTRFILHYAEHRIPAMWELHKVHHSASVMNFITAERHHPLSIVFFQIPTMTAALIVNLCFLTVFKEKVTLATLLGGNVFWIISNFAGGALRHSPVWLSFGPKVERWLISPAQHQVHHSDDPKHFDRNFGGTLAIWDRMFGTLYTTTSKREDITYGLGEETEKYSSFWSLMTIPLQNITFIIKKRFLKSI